MTAEITSRHVSCGILTNYETFSLFHHPEDRCDEIFVHAFTTSDGRSQPDAVARSGRFGIFGSSGIGIVGGSPWVDIQSPDR